MAQSNLGRYHVYRGEAEEALPHLRRWLECLVRMRHKGTLPSAFEAIAEASMLLGEPERALRLLGAASALRDEIGAEPRATARGRTDTNLSRLEDQLGSDRFQAGWSEGLEMTLDEALSEAAPDLLSDVGAR